jgi:hypothetical protein
VINFLDYEKMMKNLALLFNNMDKENKVSLLAAISNQGGLESFRKYGFDIKQYHLSYAKKLEKEENFILRNNREKVKKALENRKKNSNESARNILMFLENNNEGSSIPLSKKGFIY